MGAPIGNDNPHRAKIWRNAILTALENRSKGDRQIALVKVAEAMIQKAEEGDLQAIKELGDRLDGKAMQAVEQKTEMTATVEVSQRPQLSKEEWLAAHGLGTTSGAAD